MRHDVVDAIIATRHSRALLSRAVGHRAARRRRPRPRSTSTSPLKAWADEEGIDVEKVRERMIDGRRRSARPPRSPKYYARPIMRQVEKSILLQSIDSLWRDHLVTLDHLSKVVGWRGLAQRDPLNEYKQEAFELFQTAADRHARAGDHAAEPRRGPDPPARAAAGARPRRLSEIHIDPTTGENDAESDVTGTSGGPAYARSRSAARIARCRASAPAAAPRRPIRGCARSTRRCSRASRATPPARAAQARSSSTATARSDATRSLR